MEFVFGLCVALLATTFVESAELPQKLAGLYIQRFLELNFPNAPLSGSIQGQPQIVGQDISTGDAQSLVADHMFVVDNLATSFQAIDGTFVRKYLEKYVVEGASVLTVVWRLGEQTVTTAAVVQPGALLSSVTESQPPIFEPVIQMFTKPSGLSQARKFATQEAELYTAFFEDGFGHVVASFNASVRCSDLPPSFCDGSETCADTRVGLCACQAKDKPGQCQNSQCERLVAFVGYCGNPNGVGFDDNRFQYTVNNISAQYYNAFVRLDKQCNCPRKL